MGLRPSYYKIRAIGKVIPANSRWFDVMEKELFPDGRFAKRTNQATPNSV